MSTLVVGLGNPILGDDGVGWRVVDELEQSLQRALVGPSQRPAAPSVELDRLSLGGLALMERMTGYERAILVDALASTQRPAGEVSCLRLEELPNPTAGHLASAHDTSLRTALETGRSLGAALPDEIWVVGVVVRRSYEFREGLSGPVAAAVPRAVAALEALLAEQPIGVAAHA